MPELSKTSTASAPETIEPLAKFAGRMIKRLIVAYPNQAPKIFDDPELGAEAATLWRDELVDMGRKFGPRRVEESLTRWIRRSEYMPEISQVRDGIAPDFNPASRYEASCVCAGTGFRWLPAAPGTPTRVVKCDCYKRAARPA